MHGRGPAGVSRLPASQLQRALACQGYAHPKHFVWDLCWGLDILFGLGSHAPFCVVRVVDVPPLAEWAFLTGSHPGFSTENCKLVGSGRVRSAARGGNASCGFCWLVEFPAGARVPGCRASLKPQNPSVVVPQS